MTLGRADLALVAAYVDGSLGDELARMRFEARMADEPELAEAVIASQRADAIALLAQRARAGDPRVDRETPSARPILRLMLPLAAAAAVLVLAATAVRFFALEPRPDRTGEGAATWSIAAVPTRSSIIESHADLPLAGTSARELPAGTLRGDGDGFDEVAHERYFERVAPLHAERVRAALEAGAKSARAGHFVVGVRTEGPASAVVLVIAEDGRVLDGGVGRGHIAWPSDERWMADTGRLDDAGVHVLPRPVLTWGGGTADYDAGFLVPLGAGSVRALVGLREAPLDDGVRAALATLAEGVDGVPEAAEVLTAALVERGFDVSVVTVTEP